MWIDEHGSEILGVPECRRLLALGAKQGLHGHLGTPGAGAPVVLPVDYAVHGSDVVLRVGEVLFHQATGKLVAFEVDGLDGEWRWSVLVRGLALAGDGLAVGTDTPKPHVPEPGRRLLVIRVDLITGRRIGPSLASRAAPGRL